MAKRALGTLALQDPNHEALESVLAQPKRVALLVYLTIARPRGFHRRDTLLALLWPEQDEQHARWALNQALRAIMTEGRGLAAIAPQLAILAAWGVLSFAAALKIFRWR